MTNPSPQIQALAKPSIEIKEIQSGGNSHSGGLPANLPNFQWPENQGKALSLLALIDLAEIPSIFEWLPSSGTLLFFYDFEEKPWGDEAEEQSGWRVIYSETAPGGIDQLSPPATLSSDFIVQARSFKFEEALSYPSDEHPRFEALDLDEDEAENYIEGRLGNDEESVSSQIGGYSSAASGTTYPLDCETISTESSEEDESEESSDDELLAAEEKWVLLFEYEMEEREEEEAPGIFGGRNFSFWVPLADALAKDFSKTWLKVEQD